MSHLVAWLITQCWSCKPISSLWLFSKFFRIVKTSLNVSFTIINSHLSYICQIWMWYKGLNKYVWKSSDIFNVKNLTHCGLVMPYGIIDLSQHLFGQWLVTWWHRALLEPIFTYHLRSPVTITWDQLHKPCISHQLVKLDWYLLYFTLLCPPNLPGNNEL